MIPKFPKTSLLAAMVLSLVATPAWAIPAFARKYGTSCQTCHTIVPKLTPFGEAFRRDGYRFPGVDSDYVKQETVPLGQEGYKKVFPNAVWPGTLPISIPIAVGFFGNATLHPQIDSSAAKADNGTVFTLQDLVGEGHIWAGGSFDDKNTFFAQITFAPGDTPVDIEQAQLLFNDLVGPAHWLNLVVGRGVANLGSFGPHSSYLADMYMPSVPVTALYGATTDSFNVLDNYNGLEVNGMLGGRFIYNIGLIDNANNLVRPTESFYGHVGVKFGGMRLDGEGTAGPANAEKPWAETALTLDLFAFRSNSSFQSAAGSQYQDSATTIGGGLRGQWESAELNWGMYWEGHNHAQADNPSVIDPNTGAQLPNGAQLLVTYGEVSYVLFPWLVPAIRLEYLQLTPEGGSSINNLRFIPGVAMLVRPNIKLILAADFESAYGAPTPDKGWTPANGFALPDPSMQGYPRVGLETESITLTLWTVF